MRSSFRLITQPIVLEVVHFVLEPISPETNNRSTWVPITSRPDSRFAVWQFQPFGDLHNVQVNMGQHDRLCAAYGIPTVVYTFGAVSEAETARAAYGPTQPDGTVSMSGYPLGNPPSQESFYSVSPYIGAYGSSAGVGAYVLTIDPIKVNTHISNKVPPGSKVSKPEVPRLMERCMRQGLRDIAIAHTMSKHGWGQDGKFPPLQDFVNFNNILRLITESGTLALVPVVSELMQNHDSMYTGARGTFTFVTYLFLRMISQVVNSMPALIDSDSPQYNAGILRQELFRGDTDATDLANENMNLASSFVPGGMLFRTPLRIAAGDTLFRKPFLRYDEEKVNR